MIFTSYTEHTQAVVLGALVSILVSHYGKSQFDEQILSLLGFLVTQVITLILALLAASWVESSWDVHFNPMTIGLIVFNVSRIIFIVALWKKLKAIWLV